MRRFALGLAVLVATSAAAGQDAVTIKPFRPKAGDRTKVTIDEKATNKTTVAVQGKDQAMEVTGSKAFVYVNEVVEAGRDGAPPAKVKRTYEKARVGKGGDVTTLPVEGKTVLIEKAGDKYTFTADGKPVEGEAAKLLTAEFDRAGRKDMETAFLPPKPLKPGETWAVDGAVLKEAMKADGPRIDPDKAKAEGKLVKAYQKDGRQYGVVEVTVDAPITGLAKVDVKEGRLSVAVSGDGVIDGTAAAGTTKTVTKVSLRGTTMGVEFKVEAESVETRTVEPLKN
jgi:hypothetical protein